MTGHCCEVRSIPIGEGGTVGSSPAKGDGDGGKVTTSDPCESAEPTGETGLLGRPSFGEDRLTVIRCPSVCEWNPPVLPGQPGGRTTLTCPGGKKVVKIRKPECRTSQVQRVARPGFHFNDRVSIAR